MWNLEEESQMKRFEGHNNWVITVCYSPDGKNIASGGKDNTVRIWDVKNG